MTGLLDSLWSNTKEIFGGLLDVDPELQARRDAEAKALYDQRAQSPFFQMLGWGSDDVRSDTNVVANFLPNVGAIYRDTATMATNPAVTTEAISNLVAGGVLNLTPVGGLISEDVGVAQREMANEFGQMVKTTFGSWENLKSAAIRNPADVLGILVGAGFAVKGVKDLVTNPAVQAKLVEQLHNMPDPTQGIKRATGGLLDFNAPPFKFNMMLHHGSKHPNIEKFDTAFMGTGEGAQMKGWGIYHGGRHDSTVGFQGRDMKYEGDMVDAFNVASRGEDYIKAEMYENAMLHMRPERSLERMLEQFKDKPELHDKIRKDHAEWQNRYKDATFGDYDVYMPDHVAATMLDDAKAVYDQPQVVQDFLRKENAAYMDVVDAYKPLQKRREELEELIRNRQTDNEISGLLGETGDNFKTTKDLDFELQEIIADQDALMDGFDAIGRGELPHPTDGESIYNWLVTREVAENGIPEEALKLDRPESAVEKIISQRLDANGVLGRRYPDANNRDFGGTGENFVTFNAATSTPLKNKGVLIGETKGLEVPKGQTINIGFAGDPRRVADVADMQGGILDRFQHTILDKDEIVAPELSIFSQEGKSFIAAPGDLNRGGSLILGIDGKPFKTPVETFSGEDFMWIPENVKKRLVWASANEPIDKLVNLAEKVRDDTKVDPIFLNVRMKPTSADFAHQVGNTMIESALSRLNKFQIDELNETIRKEAFFQPKNKKGEPPKPKKFIGRDYKGIDVEDPLGGTTGDLRKEIIRIIDRDYRMDGGQKINITGEGTASAAQARIANAEPRLLDVEPLTVGNIAQLDMKNLKAEHSGHPTFPVGLRGEAKGRVAEDLSILDMFDNEKTSGLPMTRENFTDYDYRKTTMQPLSGLLSHERLMQIESNLKRRGLL